LYPQVYVLRLGHRPGRDKRVTTHVALVARAFGASGFVMEGEDRMVIESIEKVKEIWGRNDFVVETTNNGKSYVTQWRRNGGKVVHLTMYGEGLNSKVEEMRRVSPILLVVGAEKVKGWYYKNVDYNIAVGHQPHSEVASVAVFLDRVYMGAELDIQNSDAKLRIIPQRAGKRVVRVGS
jgi:tRNA (cytidine56-2'-O)-methyltransferase